MKGLCHLRVHEALVRQILESFVAERFQVTLRNHAAHMLLMSSTSLVLASLLLNATTRNFRVDAGFGSFESLGFNKLGITNLLEFLGLGLDNVEFFLFEYLHTCLFESLLNENVKHGFNFLVKVEKFVVSIENLS